ncbi:MAG: ferredoxin [Armatimonadota bacterium]
MTLSSQLRTMLIVAICLALVAVGVMAVQQHTNASTQTALETAQGACTGDCATCPRKAECDERETAVAVDDDSKMTVDPERCIGCVRCVNVGPEAFRMNSETGKAEVIEGASAEDLHRGACACPVDAISG